MKQISGSACTVRAASETCYIRSLPTLVAGCKSIRSDLNYRLLHSAGRKREHYLIKRVRDDTSPERKRQAKPCRLRSGLVGTLHEREIGDSHTNVKCALMVKQK